MHRLSRGLHALTQQQLNAIGSPHRRVYVEAAPGSGKTTVSALRFGLHRFAAPTDTRAVVAVSFTRSATEELRTRVTRQWGSASLRWPHRIVTLDTLLCDLLLHLLNEGVLHWPGGHTELDVLDSWRTALPTKPGRIKPVLQVDGSHVIIRTVNESQTASHPSAMQFKKAVSAGACTHDNVREVLQGALTAGPARRTLISYFANSVRSLTVDEVFDANDLDRDIFSLAASASSSLTLVGDPWQALYQFRGARPAAMAAYIGENGFSTHYLNDSFRWGTDRQAWFTRHLRRRVPVTVQSGSTRDADVVLASKWKALWACDPLVLPLAIKPGAGQAQEAICTLLLNEITQNALGMQAVFLHDALVTLGLEREELATLRPCLQSAVAELKEGVQPSLVWQRLTRSLAESFSVVAARQLARKPLRALDLLTLRLANDQLIPGLTCHQSKGREWNTVAVILSPTDASALAHGLDPAREDHRALYVALTRARLNTLAVT
ncbi:UvrD-helicase domain-containing protein [Streptomyces sp. NBC_00237]|uniref:UvrD-helicase domain-containing protein n=1 Tax=Streptomyces sp. NBC_00237 TaxID=2975687 RepID=UPI0022560AE5|nr:UvrD-helicase domain-containing protein [Streptomyces sp. NBC_00237]MCX5203201.1 UvrD-helicase domain-containing protein [Streptomyces sp. NBC_00237]